MTTLSEPARNELFCRPGLAGGTPVDLIVFAAIAMFTVNICIPFGTLYLFSDLFFPLTHDWQILQRYFTSNADWNFPEFQNPRQIMQVGHQILVFGLHALGFSMEAIQKIIIILLLVMCFIGVKALFVRFFPDKSHHRLLIVGAGLVYLFSPFATSVVWQRLHLGIYVFTLFPLFAAMFIDFVSGRDNVRSLVIGLLMLFLMTQSSNPVWLAACVLGAILLTLVLAFFGRRFSPLRFGLFGVGAVLVSIYWLVPFMLNLETEAQVALNNMSALSITDMRRAISAYGSFNNWFSMNPFWTGHDPNVVASANLLETLQPLVLVLFACAIACVAFVRATEARAKLVVLLGFFLIYMLLLSDVHAIVLPFWNTLDEMKFGVGFRDPYEKTAFLGASLFSLIVFGAFANANLSRWLRVSVATVLAVAVSWPALSGNLFFKADRQDGRIAQLGTIPEFFSDPYSLRNIAGPDRRVMPMPFFEPSMGSVYEFGQGNMVGMTPLYWQNDVQIVSGNNPLSRELMKLVSSEDCLKDCAIAAEDFHRFTVRNGINTIFWSENFWPRQEERVRTAIQLKMVHILVAAGCMKQIYHVKPYLVLNVEAECVF